MLQKAYSKILVGVLALVILVGLVILFLPEEKKVIEEQYQEETYKTILDQDYDECKKIDNPFCVAVASGDEAKCDSIREEKYSEYYRFIENYEDEVEKIEREVLHCKNYINMENILLQGGDCIGITEVDKKACQEMLVLRNLNKGEFENYCEGGCSNSYNIVGALRTGGVQYCDRIKETNQKSMCKALVTNSPNACKELCDVAYQDKLTALSET